jgi:uncharacterized repeat protein (TIGR03803 family)
MLLILATSGAANAATINDLYNFAGGTSDGARPFGSLTAVGSTLYGMTNEGGGDQGPPNDQVGDGTIFAFNTVTNTETVVHPFAGEPSDGAFPEGSFIQSASNPNILYAMTQGGGTGGGSLISYNIATGAESMPLNSFSVDEFTSPATGNNLLQSGNLLYGYAGGLFSFNLASGALTPLHSFSGPPDGVGPIGTPVQVGDMLYGTTQGGGTGPAGKRDGTVFSYNLDTGVETVLQSFDGDVNGSNPTSLIGSGDTLYGTTSSTIFSYDTDSGAFDTLVSGISAGPGSLLLDGSTLYGMANFAAAAGDIFAYNLDTETFTILGDFDNTDGGSPFGGLTLVGSTLYGMTEGDGTNGDGVIFSIAIPEPAGFSIFAAAGLLLLQRKRQKEQ